MAITLKHNAAEVDLPSAHCELGALTQSLTAPWTLTLRRAIAFDEPTDWQCEDAIELLRDGVAIFVGRVRSTQRVAGPDREHVLYTCAGLRDLADGVPFRRAIGGFVADRVVYNCPLEDELEEWDAVAIPGAASTVGEIIADILDAAAADLAGIIGDGSAGSGYVADELDALATVPPQVVLDDESVASALSFVLRYAPDFGLYIDPVTRQARFVDLHALAATEIPGVGGAVLRHQLDLTTEGCYSACTVQGDHERVDILESLTPAWDTGLEADWTSKKAAECPDTYGTVWRLFATAEPVAEGGRVVPERFLGDGGIVATFPIHESGSKMAITSAAVVDGTKLLLDCLARKWDGAQGKLVAADVVARFTYLKSRVAGRHPATGHAGTAHTRRGLERELFLLEEGRGRKTVMGTVDALLSTTQFRVHYGLALQDELAGMAIEFNGDGFSHLIAANDRGTITLEEEPATALQVGDSFVITAQDDTAKEFEEGTLSILEKHAKETLERVMDERVVGSVPLAGLDWTIQLGQKISFTVTNDPEYASLGATLVAVEHDLGRERTTLSLTSDRSFGPATWGELERQRQRDRDLCEARRQILRVKHRIRRRRGGGGDPFEQDDDGPYYGDEIWTHIEDKQVQHTGPGPVDRTLGGTGNYIEWISLDARGHVVDAGVGTFS